MTALPLHVHLGSVDIVDCGRNSGFDGVHLRGSASGHELSGRMWMFGNLFGRGYNEVSGDIDRRVLVNDLGFGERDLAGLGINHVEGVSDIPQLNIVLSRTEGSDVIGAYD